MNDNVENLILAQLREMREEMGKNFAKIEDRLNKVDDQMETVEAKLDGHLSLLVGLGKYLHDIDARVEHIEEKLGVE